MPYHLLALSYARVPAGIYLDAPPPCCHARSGIVTNVAGTALVTIEQSVERMIHIMRYFSPQSVAAVACMLALSGQLGVGQRVQPARASGPVPTPTAVMVVPPPPHPICQGCMVPVARVFPALYHLVQGQWAPTRDVSLNEPLRFSALVESGVAGFAHLTVHLRIRRTFIGGHGTLGALPNHIYRVGMGSSGLVHGYRRFSVDVRFRSRYMLGALFAAFHISSRTSGIEAGLFFIVHPAASRGR